MDYIKPHDISTAELERALRFYEQSPDGQYDHIAAACIRLVLDNRKALE